jgi:hypothetical protein
MRAPRHVSAAFEDARLFVTSLVIVALMDPTSYRPNTHCMNR